MKKYNLSLPDIPCNCNELAQAITGKFHNAFVQRWGDHTCNQPGCESVLVLDGNMKNTRQVCSCRDVGELKFAEMDGCVVIVNRCVISKHKDGSGRHRGRKIIREKSEKCRPQNGPSRNSKRNRCHL
ncbi:uncharacterized protein [Acropora muricata]|uniref:uncharacterized protein n=1 Tax=Acropora muricata TaxID=159855 RepID=UPI0034E5E2CC